MTTSIVYLALLAAGLVGITLSVPLQAPAVIFLGAAACCAALTLLFRPGRVLPAKGLLVLATVVIGYFATRAAMSPVRDLGVQDLMLILPAGILYLVAGFGLAGRPAAGFRQGLAWVVVLLLLLHTGAALIQLSGSDGYSLSFYFTSSVAASGDRVTGMYGYYGSFANFMVIAGLLCLSLGAWGRFAKTAKVGLLVLGCAALALALWSQSRSAALSLIVSLIVLAILLIVSLAHQKSSIRRRGNVIISTLAAVGLLASLAGGVWVFQNRAHDSTEKASEMMFDSGVRMPFWSMAAEQWADYPIVGAGSRSYSYLANRYWSPNLPTSEANPEFVHNEYLQVLADYGLIGLLLVLALLAWHLVVGVRQIRTLSNQVGEDGFSQGSNAMALSIAGVCGMVAMAVHVTFDFRTHLLANLLLLVCCVVWVLPVVKWGGRGAGEFGSQEVRKSRIGSWCLAAVTMVLALGATGLGAWQLWGGVPLLEARIAKEDGEWDPQAVPRDQWIPALEESVARVPDFNRYQRLATLYQLEANDLSGADKEAMTERAKTAYQASIERNPFNPIPWINLADMYGRAKQYQQADQAYSKASEMAKARERWFRMHSRWASLQQQWAGKEWRSGNNEAAEAHFVRAKELYSKSYEYAYFYQNKQWVVQYTRLLITYARFLDSQKRFEDAEQLFAEGREQVNWVNWQRDSKMNFYYGQHLYDHGRHIWYQRQPQQAYRLMLKSRAQLLQHQGMMKDDVEKGFAEQLAAVNKVIEFLEQTGIKPN
ncbi:MAG: O-antigen ligase family protein [Akkermansiaceae bacterium]|nr:O-antigen ligase family protein [Akkermansiaceae bacterium]